MLVEEKAYCDAECCKMCERNAEVERFRVPFVLTCPPPFSTQYSPMGRKRSQLIASSIDDMMTGSVRVLSTSLRLMRSRSMLTIPTTPLKLQNVPIKSRNCGVEGVLCVR